MPDSLRATIAWVALGGAVGASCRALAEHLVGVEPGRWPWAIFLVNMTGCLLIGVLVGIAERHKRMDQPTPTWWRPLLITGFLGGFTTFSTYIWEVIALAADTPTMLLAWGYLWLSVVVGVGLAALGLRLSQLKG